jgi:hypothetical protein
MLIYEYCTCIMPACVPLRRDAGKNIASPPLFEGR